MPINIKYEQLSSEVKEEVERYHEKLVASGASTSIEDSMNKWFETSFDGWINNRFASSEKNVRKFQRIDVELPIMVVDTLVESGPDGDPELDIVGNIVNISRGGLFFKSNRPFEVSSIVKVVINMKGTDLSVSEVEALAMVMRCEDSGASEWGVGLMFSTIYDDQQKSLDTFIFKNLAFFLNG